MNWPVLLSLVIWRIFNVIPLFVFVELNVQNLPITHADAGVAALMTLVAIMTTKELHLPLMVDSDFINRKKPKTGTCEL